MESDPSKGDACEVQGSVLADWPHSGKEGVAPAEGKSKQGGDLSGDDCISLKDLMAAVKVAPSSLTPRKKEHRSRSKLGLKMTSFTWFEFNLDIEEARQLYTCIVDVSSKEKAMNLSVGSAQSQSVGASAEKIMTIDQLNKQGGYFLTARQEPTFFHSRSNNTRLHGIWNNILSLLGLQQENDSAGREGISVQILDVLIGLAQAMRGTS